MLSVLLGQNKDKLHISNHLLLKGRMRGHFLNFFLSMYNLKIKYKMYKRHANL